MFIDRYVSGSEGLATAFLGTLFVTDAAIYYGRYTEPSEFIVAIEGIAFGLIVTLVVLNRVAERDHGRSRQ